VAIKEFYISRRLMEELIKSAKREAESLTELEHDNIIQLFGDATCGGAPCLILECAEIDLNKLLHCRLE
jgi:hypothetical protein